MPLTPPASSNGSSSSRAVSTASDASDPASSSPPMTVEDARIIFNNIGELASFSETFATRLEEALGDTLEGGNGPDHVGALFLEMVRLSRPRGNANVSKHFFVIFQIPKMEPIYTQYITKHPSALEHLNALPQTPSLAHYLTHTRELAQHLTHAWDLPSLLIKPVQRLLKYSLLLHAIIDETPEAHPDKPRLISARSKMEAVAHGVNEGRRRREVVKEVLTTGSVVSLSMSSSMKKQGDVKHKKKGLTMAMATASNLARLKSTTRPGGFKAKEGVDGNAETAAVADMSKRLKKYDEAIQNYAKDVVKWSESMKILMECLHDWTFSFGKLVGIDQDHGSAAYDAFVDVIETGILPACDALTKKIEDQLLVQLAKLKETAAAPAQLLEAMYTLEPLHYGLLNINVSKTRPSPSLLEASKSYVALRGQLFAELPQYLQLLEKGIHFTVMKLAEWQTLFWGDVRSKWEELWNSLKLETESQGNAEETVKVWRWRHEEILHQFEGLNIIQPPRQTKKEKEIARAQKGRSRSKSNSFETSPALHQAVAVSTMLATLDPYTSSTPRSPNKPRSTHSQEAGPSIERRGSNESLRSKKSGKSTKSPKHRHTQSNGSIALYQQDDSGSSFFETVFTGLSPTKPAYNRAKSMPISSPMQLKRANSQGKLLDPIDYEAIHQNSNAHYYDLLDEEDAARGRGSRKPSLHRRFTESIRPSPTPSTRKRRSPSLPNSKPNSALPSPAPSQTSFGYIHPPIPLPPLYSCYVVHACSPPEGVQYHGIPFHTLVEGDAYDVVQECGHPKEHRDLPLRVDEGEDCLLLVRNRDGEFGWALASFLLPTD